MKIHWPAFNNGIWMYESIHDFGPAWDLVHCTREDGSAIEIGLFHKKCSPDPKLFSTNQIDLLIGGATTKGVCDKCGTRVPMRYRKIARFLYPNTYIEETEE